MNRVLLVDDNPGDIELTRLAFEESALPVELVTARSQREARDLLRRCADGADGFRPDLIRLDLNLIDGSGHELLAYIKQQGPLADIPVVIVTTSDYPQDRNRSAELGASGYIVKPNSFERFIQILRGLGRLLPLH